MIERARRTSLVQLLTWQWHPTPVLLPGESHGWRSLVGCSPWGREESDTTERLHFHFSLSCIGEGNGHPLQCSCLENPRDGGAWWAAVYGVAQSRTRLKWLSSSNRLKSQRLLPYWISQNCRQAYHWCGNHSYRVKTKVFYFSVNILEDIIFHSFITLFSSHSSPLPLFE